MNPPIHPVYLQFHCLSKPDDITVHVRAGGYQGQVTVHMKDLSECYDCEPKPTPKTYPVCTIRSTPDKIEHCVAWAKYFFEKVFGKEDDANLLQDVQTARWAADGSETSSQYAWRVFEQCFVTDIQKQAAAMEGKPTSRKPPAPLQGYSEAAASAKPAHSGTHQQTLEESQKMPSIEDSAHMFLSCVRGMAETRAEEVGSAVFDKDDDLAMDFVVAASNLRCHCYGIQEESHFKIKEVAGSIIPAIASTNAIAAGLVVMEAFRILRGQPELCRTTMISERPSCLLSACKQLPPNPRCHVCKEAPVECRVDTSRMTFGDFIQRVVKGHLGFNRPSLETADGDVLYDEGDDDDEREINFGKIMAQFYLKSDSMVTVDDSSQSFKVDVLLVHSEDPEYDPEEPLKFEILGSAAPEEQPAGEDPDAEEGEQPAKRLKLATHDDDDDCICL